MNNTNQGEKRIMTYSAALGYLQRSVEGLDQYVRDHMVEEEKKFESINRHQSRTYKLLALLASIQLLDLLGYTLKDLIPVLIALM